MKSRAAALDVGKTEAAKIKELEADPEGLVRASRELQSELKNLELETGTLDSKLKKIESDLFGGKITSSKEVQNLEKEKANIMEIRGKLDSRIMELWEEIPPAKESAQHIEDEISKLRTVIAEKQTAAKSAHEELKLSYASKMKERPSAQKIVEPQLLGTYEKLREKLGVGMTLVTNENRCSTCGMQVSEKIRTMVSDDRVCQCEGCHRILFRVQQN